MPLRRSLILALLAFCLMPSLAQAAGVQPSFDLSSPSGAPFPSDRYTAPDATQLTGLRVELPKPSCAVFPSDCQDLDVLNELDGFNVQPRISIPFTGAIDPATATSDTVFLVSLRDGTVTGINQIVWNPASATLHAESDQLLDQHTTYLLVVTTGVRDAAGDSIEAARFLRELNDGHAKDRAGKTYRKELIQALNHSLPAGVHKHEVAAASLFTTQSATALLEQVRRQIKGAHPAPASFLLGSAGERTVFARTSVSSIDFARQTTVAPPTTATPLPAFGALGLFGSVGTIAFGAFDSPDYETTGKVIPAVGSATGVPAAQSTNRVHFNLFLPNGTAPAGGWPVAIFGHGFTDNKNSSPLVVAASMAQAGIATIAINVVGHGGGPLGTLTVNRTAGGPVTLPAGGRGIDQDGNGAIDSTEGVNAVAPKTLVGSRDGLRQTVIDLMQLVREVEVGMDVDGNGARDLDASRISYFGQSFGGIYGTKFLAVEPNVHAGVPNVPGGSIVEVARLGAFRPLVWLSLVARTPPLANLPGPFQFDENIPLRNLPPVVDTVPGAEAIQRVIEWTEWTSQSGNPVAYAPHLIEQPLAGVPAKAVILQFARGDKTVPNPTTSAIIRAGGLESRTTLFRNDLARAVIPTLPSNPHTFLTGIGGPGTTIALQAQAQIATFFASGGAVTIDPDGAGTFFETPMVGPPPEDLAFLP
ncbi:MAG: Ig-like domain-containing protein [Gaiellaceae bacterium MAG52_C11]|nr:Ig-like domain-containing protein [Candidatus Gaiellasilicea maunaloa]